MRSRNEINGVKTMDKHITDDKELFQRGMKCSLHGLDVKYMDEHQLIAFIGYLDDLATERQMVIDRLSKSISDKERR